MKIKRETQSIITIVIMTCGAIAGFMTQTILSTGLVDIMDNLHVKAGMVQWLITAFSIVSGVMMPLTAYLTHKFSTRILLIISLSVFTGGSILGLFAPDFSVLIIARVLQAAGCGVLFPVVQMAVFKVFPKEKWNIVMGTIGMSTAVAPTIGPAIGGVMIDAWGWRSIFVALSVLGIILLVAAFVFSIKLFETEDYPLEIPSFLLSIVLCVGIIVGLGNISTYGLTSLWVWMPICIGIICLYIFVKRQISVKHPLLQLSVLRNVNFSAGTIINSLIQFTVVGITVILPIFLQRVCGYSASVAGLIILPGALLMAACTIVGGFLANKFGIRALAILGNILNVIGFGSMLLLNASSSVWYIIMTQMIRCLGVGLATTPLNTWTLSSVTEKVEDGSAIYNTIRQIVGAMGAATMAVILTCVAGGTVTSSIRSVTGFVIAILFAFILSIVSSILAIKCVDPKVKKD